MRHIPVSGCMDEVCPFFSRKEHYDYNDECRCKHPSIEAGMGRRVHEFERYERDYDDNSYAIIPADCGEEGLYPEFCPLDRTN